MSHIRYLGLVIVGLTVVLSSAALADCQGKFLLRDLEVQRIQIANQNASQIVDMLAAMGYKTIKVDKGAQKKKTPQSGASPYGSGYSSAPTYPTYPGTPQVNNANAKKTAKKPIAKEYTCAEMPVVVLPPQVPDSKLSFDAHDFLGLNGGGGGGISGGYSPMNSYSSGGSSSSEVNGDISPSLHRIERPDSADVDQLLVFYHAGQEKKLYALEDLVKNKLDVPATQIYIEGLVLEVSEDALQQLGVQYDRTDPYGNRKYTIGNINSSPTSAGGEGVVTFVRNSLLGASGAADQTLVQLQALVSKGSAEVLSRPSVLTLSNRQATIQIIDIVQFPIQQATITGSGQVVQSAYSFEAVRPGITLNLRPRVSADLKYVSMEIDVTVESLVSANNGQAKSANGTVIATKPGSSARRVETFARIPDRTPIIIGGLIASNRENIRNRVPILGKIPIIGRLFGANHHTVGKREVIIVLTPYVIANKTHANVTEPKDTSLFDIKDATLFQDSYRVRTEDVYDLQFLLDNPQFRHYKKEAEHVEKVRPDLAAKAPFKDYLGGDIPGGDKLIDRMVYDLVRRRHFGSHVDSNRLIIVTGSSKGNSKVVLMRDLARKLNESPGKWLYITFPKKQSGGMNQNADISLRSATASWSDTLWNDSYGKGQNAIIVRNQADLKDLVDAMISAEIIQRNGGYGQLTVGEFKKGRMIAIPTFDGSRFYVVDRNVAKVYTDVEHYYRAIYKDLEKSYRNMDKAMSAIPTSLPGGAAVLEGAADSTDKSPVSKSNGKGP